MSKKSESLSVLTLEAIERLEKSMFDNKGNHSVGYPVGMSKVRNSYTYTGTLNNIDTALCKDCNKTVNIFNGDLTVSVDLYGKKLYWCMACFKDLAGESFVKKFLEGT